MVLSVNTWSNKVTSVTCVTPKTEYNCYLVRTTVFNTHTHTHTHTSCVIQSKRGQQREKRADCFQTVVCVPVKPQCVSGVYHKLFFLLTHNDSSTQRPLTSCVLLTCNVQRLTNDYRLRETEETEERSSEIQ